MRCWIFTLPGTIGHDITDLVSSRDSNGRLPLHWAAAGPGPRECTLPDDEISSQLIDTFKLLLAGNPSAINVQDEEAATPLHYAIRSHAACGGSKHANLTIRLLLEHGADASVSDGNGQTDGNTAFHIMARNLRQVQAAKFLLGRGADVRATNAKGDTAFHEAARGILRPRETRDKKIEGVTVADQIRAQDEMMGVLQEASGGNSQLGQLGSPNYNRSFATPVLMLSLPQLRISAVLLPQLAEIIGGTALQNFITTSREESGLPTAIATNAEAFIPRLKTVPDGLEKDGIIRAYVHAINGLFEILTGIGGLGLIATAFVSPRSMNKPLETDHVLRTSMMPMIMGDELQTCVYHFYHSGYQDIAPSFPGLAGLGRYCLPFLPPWSGCPAGAAISAYDAPFFEGCVMFSLGLEASLGFEASLGVFFAVASPAAPLLTVKARKQLHRGSVYHRMMSKPYPAFCHSAIFKTTAKQMILLVQSLM
ncbi:hypothetical protein VTN00DRAFT_6909 [Thermoascus crustaceus]|uniref:uncharacterized protein n=1 Tax=Thermoascus crustaceus TaxID=5088 RepID=UPI0037431C3C